MVNVIIVTVKGNKQRSEVKLELKEPWKGFVENEEFLSGRDSRILFKLFEEVVNSPDEFEQLLIKAKEVLTTKQKKFIVGLRY